MHDKLEGLRVCDVDHVIHGVCISGWRATQHDQALRGMGLTRVLKLYEASPYWPDDFTVCENALDDGELVPLALLQRGVYFIREHVQAGDPVLVQCGAGISRSSTFVLAYLLDQGYDLSDAWKLLKDKHPQADPHPQMWQSLINHYGLPYQLKDIARLLP
jgi:dual specificity phosphatase 12